MISLTNFDYKITSLINCLIPHNAYFDYFFSFFSLRGNSFFIWAVIIILFLVFEERKNPGISKKDISFASIFGISFLAASFISQILIKNLVMRPRPCTKLVELYKNLSVNFPCLTDYSFPSSHATTAFAAATVISYFDPRRRWFYLFVALLISLSRIYLNYHYFFDVTAGALIGWLISSLVLNISQRREKAKK